MPPSIIVSRSVVSVRQVTTNMNGASSSHSQGGGSPSSTMPSSPPLLGLVPPTSPSQPRYSQLQLSPSHLHHVPPAGALQVRSVPSSPALAPNNPLSPSLLAKFPGSPAHLRRLQSAPGSPLVSKGMPSLLSSSPLGGSLAVLQRHPAPLQHPLCPFRTPALQTSPCETPGSQICSLPFGGAERWADIDVEEFQLGEAEDSDGDEFGSLLLLRKGQPRPAWAALASGKLLPAGVRGVVVGSMASSSTMRSSHSTSSSNAVANGEQDKARIGAALFRGHMEGAPQEGGGSSSSRGKKRGTRGGARNRGNGGGGGGGGGGGASSAAVSGGAAPKLLVVASSPPPSPPLLSSSEPASVVGIAVSIPATSPQHIPDSKFNPGPRWRPREELLCLPSGGAAGLPQRRANPPQPAAAAPCGVEQFSVKGGERPRLMLAKRSRAAGEVGGAAALSDKTRALFGR